MVESISLGDISIAITFLVGLIGGMGYLHKNLKKWLGKAFEAQFNTINKEMVQLGERIERVDMQSCKNYLVRCFSDFENGEEINETELERFWEQYGYYTKHGGNTYITEKVERLKKEGKI